MHLRSDFAALALLLPVLASSCDESRPAPTAPPAKAAVAPVGPVASTAAAASTASAETPAPPKAGISIRSGDTLLQHLADAHVSFAATSNIPDDLKSIGNPARMRSAPVEAGAWIETGAMPATLNAALPKDHRVRWWKVRPAMQL